VKRLEQVSQFAGLKAQGVDCRAIDGISREANELAGEVEHESVVNAALIAAAQAVEHYEITRYGTLMRGRTQWATGIVSRCCSRVSTRKRKPTKADDDGQMAAESQGSLKHTVTHLGAPPVTIAPSCAITPFTVADCAFAGRSRYEKQACCTKMPANRRLPGSME
jgi:hypothetical protein